MAVAEIAVAVAGFSGVATALGRRDDATFWSPGRRYFFADLLSQSAIALFFALASLVSIHALGATGTVWGAWGLFWAACAAFGVAQGYRRAGGLPPARGVERLVGPVVTALFVALVVLQVVNALVWSAFWPVLAALLGNLVFAFVQFTRLVVPRGRRGAPPAASAAEGDASTPSPTGRDALPAQADR